MTLIKRKNSLQKDRNRQIALGLGGMAVGMLGLAFASEPLYRLFCQVTGYGGTTQVADQVQGTSINTDRIVTIRFDSNVNHKLPWRFTPLQKQMKVRVGESALAMYEATNTSNQTLVGTATFNVTPYTAATHFNKIECFCFTEQLLRPGEKIQMPVAFFIDPEIIEDRDADDLSTITLSYTFFLDQDQSAAENAEKTSIDTNKDRKTTTSGTT